MIHRELVVGAQRAVPKVGPAPQTATATITETEPPA
jgi:hypothetical protein